MNLGFFLLRKIYQLCKSSNLKDCRNNQILNKHSPFVCFSSLSCFSLSSSSRVLLRTSKLFITVTQSSNLMITWSPGVSIHYYCTAPSKGMIFPAMWQIKSTGLMPQVRKKKRAAAAETLVFLSLDEKVRSWREERRVRLKLSPYKIFAFL